MIKSKTILGLVIGAILMATTSCNLRRTPAEDGQSPATLDSQTTAPVDGTATGTATVQGATLTPLPTYTPTTAKPIVQVATDTNCRTGPGTAYDLVGGVRVGESAEIYGRSPDGQYFYVRNPDRPDEYCWLWGYYATPAGNTTTLPVFTPPPTPPPAMDFSFSFFALERCSASRYVRLKIVNTGEVTWESVEAKITDQNTSTSSSTRYSDLFDDASTCAALGGAQGDLAPGEEGMMYTWGLDHDLSGHQILAHVTLCTQNGNVGQCLTKTITFTP